MRLGKTTLSHFLSQVVVSAAGFLATFAIARVLGADGVGIYALGVALLIWTTIPVAGVKRGITKRISELEEPGAYLSAGLALTLGIAALVTTALLVFAPFVDRYVGAPVAGLLAAVFVSDVSLRLVGAILQGEKKVAYFGWLKALERLVRTTLQVGLLLLGYAIVGLFIGHAIALALAAGVGVVFVGTRPTRPGRRHVRRLADFARYSWLGSVKARTFGWMDTIVLGLFVSSTLIGIYEVAWNLASVLALVSISVRNTLFPELSELGGAERYDRIHHYLNEGLLFTGVFLIPGLVGALAIGDRVLAIYGAEFTGGLVILIVLIGARTVDAFGTQFLSVIDAIDRPEIAFRVNAVFVGTNLGLNLLLVWQFGWFGAAVATFVSGLLTFALGYRALSSLIGSPDIPFVELGKQTIAAAGMYVGVISLEQMVPSGHYVTVFVALLGAGMYGSILVVISSRVRRKALELTRALTPRSVPGP